jgi:hypothetical protein
MNSGDADNKNILKNPSLAEDKNQASSVPVMDTSISPIEEKKEEGNKNGRIEG